MNLLRCFLEAAENLATREHENKLLLQLIKDNLEQHEAHKQDFINRANQEVDKLKGELNAKDQIIATLKVEAENQRQATTELQEILKVHAPEREAVETHLFSKHSCHFLFFLLRAKSSESIFC